MYQAGPESRRGQDHSNLRSSMCVSSFFLNQGSEKHNLDIRAFFIFYCIKSHHQTYRIIFVVNFLALFVCFVFNWFNTNLNN